MIVNNIDEILKSYKEQEDSLKANLRLWLEEKERLKNINKSSLASATNPSVSSNVSSSISKTANSVSNSTGNIEISGESEVVEYVPTDDNDLLDFETTITIAEKVADGYRLTHVNKNSLSDLKENEDYIVLIDWKEVIPENPTIENIDDIFDNSFEAIKKNVKEKLNIFPALKEQDDILKEKLLDEKQQNENEVVTLSELLKGYDELLDDEDIDEDIDEDEDIDVDVDVDEKIKVQEKNNDIPNDIKRLFMMDIEEEIPAIGVSEDIKEDIKEDVPQINLSLYDEILKEEQEESVNEIPEEVRELFGKEVIIPTVAEQLAIKKNNLEKRNQDIDNQLNPTGAMTSREDGSIIVGKDFFDEVIIADDFAKAITIDGFKNIVQKFKNNKQNNIPLLDSFNNDVLKNKESTIEEPITKESTIEESTIEEPIVEEPIVEEENNAPSM